MAKFITKKKFIKKAFNLGLLHSDFKEYMEEDMESIITGISSDIEHSVLVFFTNTNSSFIEEAFDGVDLSQLNRVISLVTYEAEEIALVLGKMKAKIPKAKLLKKRAALSFLDMCCLCDRKSSLAMQRISSNIHKELDTKLRRCQMVAKHLGDDQLLLDINHRLSLTEAGPIIENYIELFQRTLNVANTDLLVNLITSELPILPIDTKVNLT